MNRQQEKPLLTIIIPVYNVEQYLEKCVKSVVPDTISYEIILVDDGSTDSSLDICMKLEGKNENIKVVHKKNGGLSSARNCGLSVAKGKYVAFVDSDDWVEKGTYDILLKKIENKDVDILKFSYVIDNYDGKIIEVHNVLSEGLYDKEQIEKSVLPLAFGGDKLADSTISKINLSATSNIYNLDFLKNNELEFISERVVGSEDFLFNIEALINANEILIVDKCLYHYVQRVGSLTKQYRKYLYLQYSNLCERLYLYLDSKNVLDKYYYEYQHFYNCLMYLCIWNECNEFAPGNSKSKVNKVKNILNEKKLQESIRHLKTTDLKSFVLKQLIKFRAAKILYNLKSR